MPSNVRIQPTEYDITVDELARLALLHDQFLRVLVHGRSLLPPHCILVFLARRPRGCADGVEFEVRVLCEE
jgi:hypothetical protein